MSEKTDKTNETPGRPRDGGHWETEYRTGIHRKDTWVPDGSPSPVEVVKRFLERSRRETHPERQLQAAESAANAVLEGIARAPTAEEREAEPRRVYVPLEPPRLPEEEERKLRDHFERAGWEPERIAEVMGAAAAGRQHGEFSRERIKELALRAGAGGPGAREAREALTVALERSDAIRVLWKVQTCRAALAKGDTPTAVAAAIQLGRHLECLAVRVHEPAAAEKREQRERGARVAEARKREREARDAAIAAYALRAARASVELADNPKRLARWVWGRWCSDRVEGARLRAEWGDPLALSTVRRILSEQNVASRLR